MGAYFDLSLYLTNICKNDIYANSKHGFSICDGGLSYSAFFLPQFNRRDGRIGQVEEEDGSHLQLLEEDRGPGRESGRSKVEQIVVDIFILLYVQEILTHFKLLHKMGQDFCLL